MDVAYLNSIVNSIIYIQNIHFVYMQYKQNVYFIYKVFLLLFIQIIFDIC